MFGSEVLRGAGAATGQHTRKTNIPICSDEGNAQGTGHTHFLRPYNLVLSKPHTGTHSKIVKKNYYKVVMLDLIPVLISEIKFCKEKKICKDLGD